MNRTLTTLSSIFTYAVEAEIVANHPVRGVRRLPQPQNIERRTISLADLALIANTARTMRDNGWRTMDDEDADWLGRRDHAMIMTAVSTGMRWGELAALHWSEVRDDEVLVTRALDAGGSILPHPKNKHHRRVRLTPTAKAVLQEWREYATCDLVFPSETGTTLHKSNWGARVWRKARARTAEAHNRPDLLEFRFHDLRHTFISLALASRVDPQVVAKWAGHSSVSMTLDRYGHHVPGFEGDLDAFDKVMAASNGRTLRLVAPDARTG